MPTRTPTAKPTPKPKRTRKEATAIPEMRPYDGPPTEHRLVLGDARQLDWIDDQSVHLVVTSPPYFNLKKYNDREGQLGDWDDYEAFHDELDRVWQHCYRALVPGGRLVCNVGDVCVARRKNNGRHHVFPLHADISVRCRRIGFDYLTPILWNKIANANFEAGGAGGFLGKPYEPNAIVKNDVEYVLMLRKPGAYRTPTDDQRAQSRLTREEQSTWFRPIWTDITGASTKDHPAPFPEDFAYRLVRMFSFVGDTVLDPFGGTGTTTMAAIKTDRNSICNELDPEYLEDAIKRVEKRAAQGSLHQAKPVIHIDR
jgi:modification methylase